MEFRKSFSYLATALALVFAMAVNLPFALAGESARVGEPPQAIQGTFETTVAASSTASLGNMGPGQILFGFSVTPTAANGYCSIYDAATLGTATNTQGVFIDEGGNASIGQTFQSQWPAPYRLVTDLTVVCSSATVVIFHQPQP